MQSFTFKKPCEFPTGRFPLIGCKKSPVMDRALENLAKEHQLTPDFRYRVPELWYNKQTTANAQPSGGRTAMSFQFAHFNFNVLDLDRSIAFYRDALGLTPVRYKRTDDFTLAYLGDGKTGFELELTWLKDRTKPYDLGEDEFHLAMAVEDMDAAHARHKEMGCICFENPAMGIYFIEDPDGYWIEIVPARKQ